MPLFSVIIPTRNREHFLSEAVASVLAQSQQDLELLIVNDGDANLKPFDDPRITMIDNRMRGHVPARNNGILNAGGTYVAFLDDDDIWIDHDHLARAHKHLETVADFTFADGIMPFPDEPSPRVFSKNATAATLARDNTILISAVCYRRSIHDTLGRFDESLPFYWDWDWYLRIAREDLRMFHDPNKAVSIRIHASNMSGETNTDARAENLARLARKHNIGPLTLKNHADFAL